MSISNVFVFGFFVFFYNFFIHFVLPFFFSEIVWVMDCEMEFRVVRETTGRRSRSWSKNWKKDPFFWRKGEKKGKKCRKQETWNRKRSFSSNIFKTSKPFKTSKTISWDSWMVLSLQFPQKVHKKSQDLHINCIKMLGCSNDSNAWSLQGSYVWNPSQLWQP